MKPIRFYLSALCLAVFLLGGFTLPSQAAVEKLNIQLFGTVNSDDARQIRRLLSPWVDPKDVSFHSAVDEHGRESRFTTVVEITPQTDRENIRIYDIVRQLNDQRFRGSHAPSQPWVVQADATVTGILSAHAGWPGINDGYYIPFWRRWQSESSTLNYGLIVDNRGQKLAFRPNAEFDELITQVGHGERTVEVEGKITAFRGHYPIMSINHFRDADQPPLTMRVK